MITISRGSEGPGIFGIIGVLVMIALSAFNMDLLNETFGRSAGRGQNGFLGINTLVSIEGGE